MSLFVINRYDGSTNQQIEEESKPTEEGDKLLQRILKKAEKRKRNREKLFVKKAFQPPIKKTKTTKNEPEITEAPQETAEEELELAADNTQKTEIPAKDSDFQFQIIGTDKFTKKPKVTRVLPDWLSNPTKISPDLTNLTTKIEDLTMIDPEFQNVLIAEGVTHYFPIQAAVLPYFIHEVNKPPPFWPRDICLSAATGSGKTLAYVLPIVQSLKDRVVRKIRALIVVPVKELAVQVYKVFQKYTKVTDLKVTMLAGTLPFEREQLQLVRKIPNGNLIYESDIVITTPGRLVDHLHLTEGLTMCDLKFLVLDEADRMMDREQNDWVYHLEQHIRRQNGTFRVNKLNLNTLMKTPQPPLKILASATLTQDPEKLYRIGLFKPRLFISSNLDSQPRESEDSQFVIPKELKLQYFVCNREIKPKLLYYLIKKHQMKKVLCFTGSGVETHRLALLLKHLSGGELQVDELSARLNPKARNITIEKFVKGTTDVLVSTDALARGLDVPNVEYVISYNSPNNVQTYIHRVGRTARAGKPGTAIALVSGAKQQKFFLKMVQDYSNVLKDISCDVEAEMKKLDKRYLNALEMLKKDLVTEKEVIVKKVKKIKTVKKKSKVVKNES